MLPTLKTDVRTGIIPLAYEMKCETNVYGPHLLL